MGFSKMLALLQIKEGRIISKEAKKYLAGHMGYIQIDLFQIYNSIYKDSVYYSIKTINEIVTKKQTS